MKGFLHKLPGYLLLAGILFGLIAVIFVPYEMYRKAQAEAWPSRKGVVTTAYARHSRGSAGRTGSAAYVTPEICGTYRDTGERFCITRVRFGGIRWGTGEKDAAEVLARYPVGSEVDVYHSADNRERVLEASSSWTEMYVLLGVGIAFLLIPVFLYLFRKRIDPVRYRDS